MQNNYDFIYKKPKFYQPARTKVDIQLKEIISMCDSCGAMDLDASMGCEEYPTIDLCMSCYNIGYENIEKTDQNCLEFTPKNILVYKSPFPYYYHCLNIGKPTVWENTFDRLQ